MNEIDPLLRLSWFVAAATPWTAQPCASGPVLSPPREQPPVVCLASDSERERHERMACLLGGGAPRFSGAPDASGIPNNPALTDTWFFGLGACFMTSNTQAELKSGVGAGAVIDFEDAFGLPQSTWAPELMARWRFSDRWRLELEAFQLNRSNTKTTLNDFDWGDVHIPAGTSATAKFDVSVLRLSCGYSFFKTQDKEIGVALGFHVSSFNAKVSTSGGEAQDAKVTAPLPVASMYGQFALTDEWSVDGRLDVFRLAYDPFYGSIISVGVDALYQPWRHWGIGIGWRTLQISGGLSAPDWDGQISTEYTGPVAFISSSF